MNRLLVTCGPTATGKTRLALHLSKVFNGEVVSSDSRQVYKGMDIGTGKDLPKGARFRISDLRFKNEKIGYYELNRMRIWGYDLVEPKDDFSVSKYVEIAEKIVANIWKRRKLPILVGGSGLYIKGLVDGIPTASIPKNESLRKSLENKNSDELFDLLAQLDPVKAASLNMSDKQNPRRLVRAIEVAFYTSKNPNTSINRFIKSDYEVLFIGLSVPKEILYKRIKKRVFQRVKLGIEDEITKLLTQGIDWGKPAMQSLGYGVWRDYLTHKSTKKEVIEKWIRDEQNYAKRQLTWFKKDSRIRWLDISKMGWEKSVEKTVGEWHNRKSLIFKN